MLRPPVPNAALAAGLTLLASAFIAGTTLLAKSLTTEALGSPLPTLQISHGRFLFAFLVISEVFLWHRQRLVSPALRLHFGRSLFGCAGVNLMFASTAFILLNPIFGMALAVFLLGEKVGLLR